MNILEKVCSVPCCNWFFCAWIAKVSDFAVQYIIVGGTELILQIKARTAAMKLLINSEVNLQIWKVVAFLPVRYFSLKCLT